MHRLRFQWIIVAAWMSLVAAATSPKCIEVEGGAWHLDPSVLSEVQFALKAAHCASYRLTEKPERP